MKTYGWNVHGRRFVVAAPSKAAARKAFGASENEMRHFCAITGNEAEIAAATATPGTPYEVIGKWDAPQFAACKPGSALKGRV